MKYAPVTSFKVIVTYMPEQISFIVSETEKWKKIEILGNENEHCMVILRGLN